MVIVYPTLIKFGTDRLDGVVAGWYTPILLPVTHALAPVLFLASTRYCTVSIDDVIE